MKLNSLKFPFCPLQSRPFCHYPLEKISGHIFGNPIVLYLVSSILQDSVNTQTNNLDTLLHISIFFPSLYFKEFTHFIWNHIKLRFGWNVCTRSKLKSDHNKHVLDLQYSDHIFLWLWVLHGKKQALKAEARSVSDGWIY